MLRFRCRNFFGDNVAYGQRTHDSDSHNDFDGKKPDVQSKQVPVSVLTKLAYLTMDITNLTGNHYKAKDERTKSGFNCNKNIKLILFLRMFI